MKIGLFGGTFNPPHLSHVNIACQAIKQLGLDKLLVVPCGDPPHKKCDVDKFVRLKLCRLAFNGVDGNGIVNVWDYEISKPTKSYTAETLYEVKRLYPNAELFLIIGGDSLRDFHTWYCPNEIADMATIVVADRGRRNRRAVAKVQRQFDARVVNLDVKPNAVSSTELRLRYQFGLDNGGYVPKAVDEFIVTDNLYAEYRNTVNKLRAYLKPQRFEHTFYVVKRGLELANNDERDKVFVACLLHDCAKYVDECDYAKYGFVRPNGMPKPVVHSFLGAKVAEKDFGITDPEILDAIAYHTTGRPNMTRLDKIVYVADKTEQTRPYPLSHLLKGSLDNMFVKCLAEANEYREQAHGDSDFELTNQTLEFYLNGNNKR